MDLADPSSRRTLALMTPRAIGLGASQITFVVVTALATTLGVGAVTAFTVAFTLLQIPIGIIGVPLGIVLFPTLSREAALGNLAEFRGLLIGALRVIVFVMIPVAALTAILPSESVALLFPTFTETAVDLTAATLYAFSFGLVAHALIAVLARAFYARQDTLTPVLAAVMAVAINTVLAAILITPLGLPGVALAIAIAAWLEAAALLVLLWRRVTGLDLPAVAWVGVRTLLAAAGASVVAGLVQSLVGRCDGPGGDDRRGGRPVADRNDRHRDRRVRRDLRGARPRLADHRTALYRRDHGRRAPPSGPNVTRDLTADDWDAFVAASQPGSYLQTAGWADVKAVNGWAAHRLVADDPAGGRVGAQVLVRRPRPLPWGFAYAPRGPVFADWSPAPIERFTSLVRDDLPAVAGRVSHLRIDPEIEAGTGPDAGDTVTTALRASGWRPAPPIQPASTRIIDLAPDEDDPVRRPAQEVAPVRQQGPCRRDRRGRRRRGPVARVLPDLPGDGRPGRLPDPYRVGLSRRVGGVPSIGPGPAAVRPGRRRRRRRRRCSSCAAVPGWSSRTAA